MRVVDGQRGPRRGGPPGAADEQAGRDGVEDGLFPIGGRCGAGTCGFSVCADAIPPRRDGRTVAPGRLDRLPAVRVDEGDAPWAGAGPEQPLLSGLAATNPVARSGLALVLSSALTSAVGLCGRWVVAGRPCSPAVVRVVSVALSTMQLLGGIAHLN